MQVRFLRNLLELGTSVLPRRITDCWNEGEGLLVGDAGLSVAELRFFPRALDPTEARERARARATVRRPL